MLEIKNLHISIEDEKILKEIDLTINTGEIHAIMGPNGTGKSTLSAVIVENPDYGVTEGEVPFDGVNVLDLEVDEHAHLGLFLAMQYPDETPGITNTEFTRAATNAKRDEDNKMSVVWFLKKLDSRMELLNMPEEMVERYLNEDFSDDEKKRNEILQLLVLEPAFTVLDRVDSSLDIDTLKVVSKGVNEIRSEDFGMLIIAHCQCLLNYITPDAVHIMMGGHVVKTGGADLAKRLETEGYAGINQELGIDYKEET